MKTRKKNSQNPWERTPVQCLLRHRHSGRYYGRFKVSGKQKWVALDTDVFTVAKQRLVDEADKINKVRGILTDVAEGKAMVGQLCEIYRERVESNPDFRPATVKVRTVALKRLLKTWPGLADMEPRRITPVAVQAWANRLKRDGTSFKPPGTKTVRIGNSATSVNHAIDTLRRVLDIALEQGQIHTNAARIKPASGRLKKKVTRKKLVIPSRGEVVKLLAAMDAIPGWGHEAADLCRFFKMTGARIGEVRHVTWNAIDWDRKVIHLPGYKTETSDRYIPLFPTLEIFLKDLIERRKTAARWRKDKMEFLGPDDAIFRIRECQKTIDAACSSTGVHRITHHDFRHLFATVVIESGVDIPTLSRWLGHNDGGILAMKTYGHLRSEHSLLSAQKVVF